jgi:hypothetical protein
MSYVVLFPELFVFSIFVYASDAPGTHRPHSNIKAQRRKLMLSLPCMEVRRVLDRGKYVESKVCVSCNRPFNWRKKWERSWDGAYV